jgi:hypothetical protein
LCQVSDRAAKNDNDENVKKSFGIQTPVIPHHGRVLAGGTRIALLVSKTNHTPAEAQ